MQDIQSLYLAKKEAHIAENEHPGLRERQKELAKSEILDAALDLFNRHGYTKTTMQMIADQAHVGVATVFRMFGKKGAILAALSRRDLEEIFDDGWKVVLNPLPSLEDTVIALVNAVIGMLDKPSKHIRTPSHLWPAVVAGKAEIDEVVRWADEMTILQFYGAIVEFEQKYKTKLPFEAEDMAINLFYIFNGHYAAYLAEGTKKPKELADKLDRRIRIILNFEHS